MAVDIGGYMQNIIIVGIAGAAVGFILSWFVMSRLGKSKISQAQDEAGRIINDAEKESNTIKKEKILEAKEEWYRQKQKFDNETRHRKQELERLEKQLQSKEMNLDRKVDLLNKKDKDLNKKENEQKQLGNELDKEREKIDQLYQTQIQELEKISRMSSDEAKKMLIENMTDKAKLEATQMIKDIKDEAKLTANREAREVVIGAIQRSAADHSVESTVSVVNIPSDEMKGRIIGREGRNIRAFENATGIEVIVDDTPEAVVLSGFDPLRREIAKMALEKLISDGRIHPGRIEDVMAKAKKEMEEKIIEAGEQALLETGVHKVHPELIKLLGKLKYRTSYGQNVLQHSIEVSYLAGLMASQLGLEANLAKRAGLLHDIGKAIDKYTEGTHTAIGKELAKKYNEHPVVVNAIASHHEDEDFISPICVLVLAADAVSGSRPGARRETLEGYVKRLEKLEDIAESFSGVSKTFAIQAGREIRVMVEPDKTDDTKAFQLANDIANKIQTDLEYPGQIKVTVLREYRAVGIAK